MRKVGYAELSDISVGAAVLGSGGGGDPYIGRLMAQRAISRYGPVTLLTVDEVPDEALIVSVSVMGAPTVLVEKPPAGTEHALALRALSDLLGEPVTHLACVEAGGVNSMVPFVVAANTGLPLIDADGMGRAFPELQMKLPALVGIHTAPMAVADEKGNVLLIRTSANAWSERLARAVTIEMGCSACTAQLVMRGHQLRDAMACGTLTRAQHIGESIRTALAAHEDPVEAARQVLDGVLLFSGKIIDVSRATTSGFARGAARIAGLDDCSGSIFELEFQNEFLMARRDSDVVATVPDLISVFDSVTGMPVPAEALRFGLRVSVLGAPCDERWRSAEGLELVGPRYFGYPADYVPVEATRKGIGSLTYGHGPLDRLSSSRSRR